MNIPFCVPTTNEKKYNHFSSRNPNRNNRSIILPNIINNTPYRFVGSNFFFENRKPDKTPPPEKQRIIPSKCSIVPHSSSLKDKTNCVIFPVKCVVGVKNSNSVTTLTIPANVLRSAIQTSK